MRLLGFRIRTTGLVPEVPKNPKNLKLFVARNDPQGNRDWLPTPWCYNLVYNIPQ